MTAGRGGKYLDLKSKETRLLLKLSSKAKSKYSCPHEKNHIYDLGRRVGCPVYDL